jgi:DNA-binding HxlR family transcriptional regulator
MREHGQYCPVALASGVFGDRWTPLILREMAIVGSTRFNEIERGLPGISRSLLHGRLRHLERKGVVERVPSPSGHGHEYHLTQAGKDIAPLIMAIGEWAVRWFFTEPEPEQVDPVTLMWWLHRRIDFDRTPDERVVLEFRFSAGPGLKATTIWLVVDRGDASVCTNHPGFDSDVTVFTDAVSMTRVFAGIDTLAEAREREAVRLEGPPRLVKAFPRWFLWSPFAPAVRARSVSLTTTSI